jgi:hypothetical protein
MAEIPNLSDKLLERLLSVPIVAEDISSASEKVIYSANLLFEQLDIEMDIIQQNIEESLAMLRGSKSGTS